MTEPAKTLPGLRLRKIGKSLFVYCTEETAAWLKLIKTEAEKRRLKKETLAESSKRVRRKKRRQGDNPPPKNLAADRNGVPNAVNILKGDTLWMRDGTTLPRAYIDGMLRMRGRKP